MVDVIGKNFVHRIVSNYKFCMSDQLESQLSYQEINKSKELFA